MKILRGEILYLSKKTWTSDWIDYPTMFLLTEIRERLRGVSRLG